MMNSLLHRLAVTTALVAPVLTVSAASAQELGRDCARLAELALEMTGDNASVAAATAQRNEAADCVVMIERIDQQRAGAAATGDPEARRAARAVRRQIQIEEEAEIEGSVIVEVPSPEVTVESPPVDVEVTRAQPDVEVRSGGGEVVIRQGQPEVQVEIPAPIVTVRIPAPEIFVRMDDPQVALSGGDPQVEVRQGEPTVSVSQGEPRLAVDVDLARDQQQAGGQPAPRGQRVVGDEMRTVPSGEASTEADVSVVAAEPRVTLREPESEPQVSFERARPTVTFERADPQVNVAMSGEPQIEVSAEGEPTVTFETTEERDARREREQQAALETRDAAEPAAAGAPDREAGLRMLGATDPSFANARRTEMTVGDLLGYDVESVNGEDLGDAEEIVSVGDRLFLVISHGGFLGIGEKEVTLPMERVVVREDRIVVHGVTEADIEDMPDRSDQTRGLDTVAEDRRLTVPAVE